MLHTTLNTLAIDPGNTTGLGALVQKDEKAGLHAAASQFEAILMGQLLASMRESNSFADDESSELSTFRGLYDQQLVQGMVQSGGLGLADALIAQLLRNAGLEDKPLSLPETTPALPASVQKALAGYAANLGTAGQGLPPVGQDLPVGKQGFAAAMLPHASAAAERLGVSPRLLVAHAALESGWGQQPIRHPDGRNSHNLFGIKATAAWQGDSVAVLTTEYRGGVANKQVESFRAYGSYAEAFDDYARLLQSSPRYRAALGGGDSAAGFALGLQRGGYATDPAYAAKLVAVADSLPRS